MVKEQETRKVVKMLKTAGWVPAPKFVGSHHKWTSPDGTRNLTIPEGHKTISAGVMRQVLEALKESE